ncbi:hypothetical protein KSC_026050 [Ktedonobacter sp. SOSP1-52]|uniref:hypothetical protein n=1 Tax=Ktedonobacter sp. SOSP1-52 TaxID=2778366 RepID=UPI001915E3A0|nr:hypothetical protein [Ktedonobacter sp. SOSP1-52]GHO63713.1 hypothetical protein KSC_026050 [Ktedonobacter sp. SOSP1-52]
MCERANRKRYPSDVTDAQWELIEPFIPKLSTAAAGPTIPIRVHPAWYLVLVH